ncbi:MAG: HNH endonuclease [Ignavibacteriales bacterium]|nr:HNH endonuclease [Ignavibacteriales bacterium]
MNFYVAVTDNEWFTFLKQRKPDEVNFWRPGGQTFSALSMGEPLLFKLHTPNSYIVGGGFFVRYTKLPLSMVWKVFGEKNGTDQHDVFIRKIFSYLNVDRQKISDPEIGCVVLGMPFFFERQDWILVPSNWSSNIVRGKRYDTSDQVGKELWGRVEPILFRQEIGKQPKKYDRVAEQEPRYGTKHFVETRFGQSAFRTMVIDAYGRRCAVSGEKTVPVLEASHIKPYADSGPNIPHNGILLRADLHILFDQGYMTITNKYQIEISRRIKEEYENGRDYYKYNGNQLISLPSRVDEQPASEFLQWHQENVFKG